MNKEYLILWKFIRHQPLINTRFHRYIFNGIQVQLELRRMLTPSIMKSCASTIVNLLFKQVFWSAMFFL